MDTLQLAMSEVESWNLSQIVPVMDEQSDGPAETLASAPPRWRCQVDALWVSA